MPKHNKCKRQRRLQAMKMHNVLRARKGQKAPKLEREGDIGDEWISCQTDANKLVKGKQPVKGSLFDPDESWPENSNVNNTKKSVTTTKKEVPVEFDDVNTEECDLDDTALSYSEEIQQSPELKPVIAEIDLRVTDAKEDIEDWVIKKQLCRCCLVEGTFDSMHSPALGEDISYDGMLMKSFNMQLFPVSSDVATALRGVCVLCAARLRDAYAFQHQVKMSEACFRDLYTRNCITVVQAEIELKQEEADNDNEFDNHESEDTSALLVEHIVNTKVQLREEGKASPKTPLDNVPKRKIKPDELSHYPLATEEYTKKGHIFKCNKCGKHFRYFRTVNDHYKRVHLKHPFLKCGHCETKFRSHKDLMSHTLEEHNIDERYKCGACEKMFNAKHQLQNHYNNYHKMGKKLKCSMCDFECFDKNNLSKHLVKHKTSKDYKCKYCEKTFLRRTTLHYHERIHTGDKRKVCAECGQAFVQKASLNYHMTKHHPEVKF